MLDNRTLFIADTYINEDPSAEELAEIAKMAADEVARFGLPPKVAFLSHSNYGSSTRGRPEDARGPRPVRRRQPRHRVRRRNARRRGPGPGAQPHLLDATLTGEANVLICPNLDAANILFNVLKTTAATAPPSAPSCWVRRCSPCADPSSTVRRVVNMTALAAAQAQTRKA
jgi:malate dehydrogenase (oxaloacetate-decarboxylating)(NADP+)